MQVVKKCRYEKFSVNVVYLQRCCEYVQGRTLKKNFGGYLTLLDRSDKFVPSTPIAYFIDENNNILICNG